MMPAIFDLIFKTWFRENCTAKVHTARKWPVPCPNPSPCHTVSFTYALSSLEEESPIETVPGRPHPIEVSWWAQVSCLLRAHRVPCCWLQSWIHLFPPGCPCGAEHNGGSGVTWDGCSKASLAARAPSQQVFLGWVWDNKRSAKKGAPLMDGGSVDNAPFSWASGDPDYTSSVPSLCGVTLGKSFDVSEPRFPYK